MVSSLDADLGKKDASDNNKKEEFDIVSEETIVSSESVFFALELDKTISINGNIIKLTTAVIYRFNDVMIVNENKESTRKYKGLGYIRHVKINEIIRC